MRSLAFCVLIALFAGVELVQVELTQGKLEGEVLTTIVKNISYYSFKGIPYAAPPVGSNRFKAPQPPLQWEGVRDATSHCASCPQVDFLTALANPGNEDCLCLNVYTPSIKPKSPLSVIVYIHGGGFKSGSGNSSSLGPDFLINNNVVLVTINYRLEALGFLSLGTEDIPGNAGLKDQVATLRWVKYNIEKFGGNPKKVTIMGQSAGAASVGYHILSPMSKGLFHRAIGLSSVPINDYATVYHPVERALTLCKQLGLETKNTTLAQNFLQSLPVSKLYNTTCRVLIAEEKLSNIIKFYNFVPSIEEDFGNNNAFITKEALEALRHGPHNSVDVMFGFTNQEMSTIADFINSTLFQIYDEYLEMFTPLRLSFKNNPDVNLEVASKIREHYFADAALNEKVVSNFITYASDASFVCDIIRYISILSTRSNRSIYLYENSMSSALNMNGNPASKYGIVGAMGHLDDLNYIFPNTQLNSSLLTETSIELRLVNLLCTLVTNFAKYGDPTYGNILPSWPKYNTTTKSYMKIGNTLNVANDPKAEAMAFWESIYTSLGLGYY